MLKQRFFLPVFLSILLIFIATTYRVYGISTITNDNKTHLQNKSEEIATVYTVTNTNDSGTGSLRQAITDANANSQGDIVFNIPTTDGGFDGAVFTINPLSAFPIIRYNITIDGATQTAFTGDTNPDGPEIVVHGSNGLGISGDNNRINDLIVNGSSGGGIWLSWSLDQNSSNNQILNNYLGTDATGLLAVSNAYGININGFASPGSQANQNIIMGNVISGNVNDGIELCDASSTIIMNNKIGVDRTGLLNLGNGRDGIRITCAGAPNNQIENNIIAFNGGDGILDRPDYRFPVAYTVDGHQGNKFSQNTIFSNGGIGINILPPPFGYVDDVTPNDPGDTDVGGNLLLNFPVLFGAQSMGSATNISGTLNSEVSKTFGIELFLNDALDPTGHGEGQTYLTTITVTTNITGDVNFTTTLSQSMNSNQYVTATTIDTVGNTSEFSAAITVTVVNLPPTADASGPYMADEGSGIVLDGSGSTDADGTLVAYDWDLDNDGQFDDAAGITTTLTIDDNGFYTVSLRVTDDGGLTDQDTTTLDIQNVAPTVNAGSNQNTEEGGSISLLPATFTDPGPQDTHTATINWGDGTTEPGTVVTNTVSGSHLYDDDGSYTVQVCVTDDDNGTGCDSFTATISNVAPTVNVGSDQSADEGSSVNLPPATFTDPGTLDAHTATINWGDGTTEPGTVVTNTISGSHVYVDNGNYTVQVCVTDDDGGTDCDSFTAAISNVAPTVNAGGDQSADEGSAVSLLPATFTDPGLQDAHTAMINWGDGITETGTVVTNTVSGSHLFVDNGNYTVQVCVTDDDGGMGCDSFTAVINNTNPTLSSVAITSNINENEIAALNGNISDLGASDTFTLTVDWGDGISDTFAYISGTVTFTETHLYLDDSQTDSYTVTLNLMDNDGGVAVEIITAVVQNVTPTVDAGQDQSVKTGNVVDFDGSYTDPGTQDTHSILWDFGDGEVANGTLNPSHLYTSPGTYLATLTVLDDDGGSDSDTLTITVTPYLLFVPIIVVNP